MVNMLILVGGVIIIVQHIVILILVNKIIEVKPIREDNNRVISGIIKKLKDLTKKTKGPGEEFPGLPEEKGTPSSY